MTRLKYCEISGKVRYPTFWSAFRVLGVMNAKYYHAGRGSVYKCNHCHDWHLTHYDDPYGGEEMAFCHYVLSKKQKRSLRSALRRRRRPVMLTERMGERIGSILTNRIEKMIKANVKEGTTMEMAKEAVNIASADIKNNMGLVANAAYWAVRNAVDRALEHPMCREQLRKDVKNQVKVWDRYFANMQTTYDKHYGLRLFDVQSFDSESKKVFKEGITNQEYFELWQATGGEAYFKSLPNLTVLRLKFEELHQKAGHKHYHILGWLDVAGMLVALGQKVYKERIEYITANTMVMFTWPKPEQLFGCLSMEGVERAFFKMRDKFPILPDLTDDEVRNLALTSNDVRDAILSFEEATDNIMSAVDSYDELMASKGTIRKLKIDAAEQVEGWKKKQLQERLEKMRKEAEAHE